MRLGLRQRQRLEALEMWIWRRMERFSWLDKVQNADILTSVKEDKCMLILYGSESTNGWGICYAMKYY